MRPLLAKTSLLLGLLAAAAWGGTHDAQSEPPQLADFGAAPEIAGIEQWLNSEPLTIAGLKGKVILIDFWTYACFNCANTLPHVMDWYQKYKDRGFVVIGVHSPEFAFERVPANVRTAVGRFEIKHPVALDNRYATWKAYGNRYWPAVYLIDRQGRIRLKHVGEGSYEEIERAIRALLYAK